MNKLFIFNSKGEMTNVVDTPQSPHENEELKLLRAEKNRLIVDAAEDRPDVSPKFPLAKSIDIV